MSIAAHRPLAPRVGRQRERALSMRVLREHLDAAEEPEERKVRGVIDAQ
jgi:hypothetical protein